MADPFSIATGALTVAEVGLKLHNTLKEYIEGVVNADKHFRRITDEVRTTSWALQELGAQLQSEDGGDLGIFKPAAKIETKAALDGCRDTFQELEELLNLSVKKDAVSAANSSSLSRISRLKFPGRNKKIKSLLGELERLKTTLLLICHIVPAAKRAAKKDELPLQDRVQLEYLIKAWKDAKVIDNHPTDTPDPIHSNADFGISGTTFATLDEDLGSGSSALPSITRDRDLVADDHVTTGLNADDPVTAGGPLPGALVDIPSSVHNAATFLPQALLDTYPVLAQVQFDETPTLPSRPHPSDSFTAWISAGQYNPQHRLPSPPAPPKRMSDSQVEPKGTAISERRQELSSQLDACASAVGKLSSAIERLSRSIQNDEQKWDLQRIHKSYAVTRRAVDGLLAIDQDDPSDDNVEFAVMLPVPRAASASRKITDPAIPGPLRSERELELHPREQRHGTRHVQRQGARRKRSIDQMATGHRLQIQQQSEMSQQLYERFRQQISSSTMPQIDVVQAKLSRRRDHDQDRVPIPFEPAQVLAEKLPDPQLSGQAARQPENPLHDYAATLRALEEENLLRAQRKATRAAQGPPSITTPRDNTTPPEISVFYSAQPRAESYIPPRDPFIEDTAVASADFEGDDDTYDEAVEDSDEAVEDSTVPYTDPIIALLREWTTIDV